MCANWRASIFTPKVRAKNVPLGQVAQIVPQWQLAKIKRRDLYRTLTVTCDGQKRFYGAGCH